MATGRVECVGAVIKDAGGRLLLIKRGHEPGAGLWSLPGGRIEPGETDQQATCGSLVGTAELPGLDGAVIGVRDYLAVVTGGELAAGDDAADAAWVSAADLARLPLTEGLAEFLAARDVGPT